MLTGPQTFVGVMPTPARLIVSGSAWLMPCRAPNASSSFGWQQPLYYRHDEIMTCEPTQGDGTQRGRSAIIPR